jgi:GH24 family phage-related lysozyme (muramidase)
MARTITDIGAQMLTNREGVRLVPYNDSRGHATVGIGHLIHHGPVTAADKTKWTLPNREAAVALFRKDLSASYEPAVEDCVKVPLSDNQFDALVSLCYNIGVNGFKNSTVVKRLNAGDYLAAATAFMMWNKPKEITGRRKSEMDQFRTPYGRQVPSGAGVVAKPLLRGESKKFAKADWMHPVLRIRLEAVFDEVPFTCISGGRSTDRQAELYRLFKAGKGNPANRPGTSWHEFWPDGSNLAQAADIHPKPGNSFRELHNAGRRHGVHFPVRSEGWHVQPLEAKSSSRVRGQGLGPVSAYWDPETEEEEVKANGANFAKDSKGVIWVVFWTDAGLKRIETNNPPEIVAYTQIGLVPDPGGLDNIKMFEDEVMAQIPVAS